MINLLPYNRRELLKSSYKKRLMVITFISASVALMPLLLVIILLSYLQQMDYSILNTQFDNSKSNNKDAEVDKLIEEIKGVNIDIKFFQDGLSRTKHISEDLQSIVKARPGDVTVNNINFSKTGGKATIIIFGISGTRDSIIKYGNALDKKNGGICSEVSLPVTTYAKKIDVPFSITCNIVYEIK